MIISPKVSLHGSANFPILQTYLLLSSWHTSVSWLSFSPRVSSHNLQYFFLAARCARSTKGRKSAHSSFVRHSVNRNGVLRSGCVIQGYGMANTFSRACKGAFRYTSFSARYAKGGRCLNDMQRQTDNTEWHQHEPCLHFLMTR